MQKVWIVKAKVKYEILFIVLNFWVISFIFMCKLKGFVNLKFSLHKCLTSISKYENIGAEKSWCHFQSRK